MEMKLKQNGLKPNDGGLKRSSNHSSQPIFNKSPMETLIDDVSDAANRLNNVQLGDEIERQINSNDFMTLPKASSLRCLL